MDDKKEPGRRAGKNFADKGFYIVLFLCVAVIGVSTWIMLAGSGADVEEASGSNITALPAESDANAPETAGQAVKPSEEPQEPEIRETMTGESALEEAALEEGKEIDTSSIFVWPINGAVEVPFAVDALVYDETMEDWRTHAGVDIAAEPGTHVMAISDGQVESVYKDALYGTTVVIDHGRELRSVYSSLADITAVAEGDYVTAGSIIGAVGNTAICESEQGSHLHFAMVMNGEPADPALYIAG